MTIWTQTSQALKVLKNSQTIFFTLCGNEKMSKVQKESNQQMNKGRPAPPYTDKRNPVADQNRPLKTKSS